MKYFIWPLELVHEKLGVGKVTVSLGPIKLNATGLLQATGGVGGADGGGGSLPLQLLVTGPEA